MNKSIFRKGNAALGILLICSFGAIILAGWSFSLSAGGTQSPGFSADSMGTHVFSTNPYDRNWWAEGEDSSGRKRQPVELERRGEDELKLNLPNVGVKNPDDINWPYKDGFTYELAQGGNNGYSIYANKGTFTNLYETNESGGTLKETFEFKYTPPSYGHVMVSVTSAQFDPYHKATRAQIEVVGKNAYLPISYAHPTEIPAYDINIEVIDGKLHWTAYDYTYGTTEFVKEEVGDIKINAPDDGFFFYTGSDTPGFLVLMLSALELDGDEPASVWVLGGGNLALWITAGVEPCYAEPIFTRVTVFPLDECPTDIKRWYKATREFFYDYEPDDLRTYILFGEGANYAYSFTDEFGARKGKKYAELYNNGADIVIVYLDDKDRLVRIEQIGSDNCTAAELAKIGTDDKWWGNKATGE